MSILVSYRLQRKLFIKGFAWAGPGWGQSLEGFFSGLKILVLALYLLFLARLIKPLEFTLKVNRPWVIIFFRYYCTINLRSEVILSRF
jgi:hypothetical protein